MWRFLILASFVFLNFLMLLGGCSPKKTQSSLVWDQSLYTIGSQSSPRTADLNQDGTLDIVMGAGKNEFQVSEQGIIALDGKTGKVIWQQEAPDQVYGSATLYDITGDSIKDVFIGGRTPHLKALDGKTGKVIWEYKYQYETDPVLRYARFNFYNLALIPDQNNDGLKELLTINGGNAKAEPNSTQDRFPGVLMVIDPKTGHVLAADTMPDGRESYMSPVCFKQPNETEWQILFGTGGETISGNLYQVKLSDLMQRKLNRAKVIASEKGHGFIAPPVVVDITDDGQQDIIAISHGSTVFSLNGKNQKQLWQQQIPGTESSNSFAVGYFTDDDTPDFFTFVSKGAWPNNTGTRQIMLDGKNGAIAYKNALGCSGFSSPVVYDLNHDGQDEVIISINEYDCNRSLLNQTSFPIENKLLALNFKDKSINTIDQTKGFKNIFSTPWIGDLDQDGYLDIVHCQYYSHSDLLSFLGMRVKRIDTPIKIKDKPVWGSYMGSNGSGVFTAYR
ncbi:PQQ-binding-like beta-propeller repeat protein [Adhaeribacter swui]|uniref:PQQ-binding-like beta-propeller repeat protein n=1 Tax=Adhaeribacter swui TaxID=2086471 RepID=A0A7G7GA26_9BACT|nr:PQQ-binding-like beta-propeller repeat protein [Adhaeribacter swui]QNF34010.1 PQQ-binding-like beta-propeller repeat protein [Adhaeribacter swui]